MNNGYVQNLMDSTLRYVEVSSHGFKRAADEIAVHRGMQKKAAAVAPEVLDLMLKTGAAREEQKDAAAAMLGDHAATLGLLKEATTQLAALRQEIATIKKASLGEGVDADKAGVAGEKRAFDSQNDPFPGRPTSKLKESDLALMKVLDNPHG